MSYQNPAQECYGTDNNPSQGQQLLNPNVGVSNSSRGEGTTLSEITSKMRFLNCGTSLFVILFYAVPLLNPIRLTMLLASPTQLILEVLVACCALSLFIVEAGIPIIGERVLESVRRTSIDLDLAKGRLMALMIMATACGMVQYLVYVSKHGNGAASIAVDDGAAIDTEAVVNATFAENTTTSNVSSSNDIPDTGSRMKSHQSKQHTSNILSAMIQSTIISPTMWILISMIVYTLHVMQTYPDYVYKRAYPEHFGLDRVSTANATNTTGSGMYQNLGNPSWAQPVA